MGSQKLSGQSLLGLALSMGWMLPSAAAVGAGLGYLVDRLLGTFPVGTIVVGMLGVAAGIYRLYRELVAPGPGGNDGGSD